MGWRRLFSCRSASKANIIGEREALARSVELGKLTRKERRWSTTDGEDRGVRESSSLTWRYGAE